MLRAKLVLLSAAAGAMLTLAISAPGSDGEGRQKHLLEIRDSDPERYARIQKNFERFRAMPPEQQEKLRQLDRQLHDEDSQTQARLMRVMDAYAAWFTRLPDADRQHIKSAATAEEKLKIVRDIRERQWVEQLPQAARDELAQAAPDKQADVLEKWRKEERKHHEEWAVARKTWDVLGSERPKMMGDFMNDMTAFVENRLVPVLSAAEKAKLGTVSEEARRTGNMGPVFRLVLELAETHPILGLEPNYSTLQSLPEEYRAALKSVPSKVSQAEGTWPAFPLAVADEIPRSARKTMKTQLGPSTAKDFPAVTEEGIRKLQMKLSPPDRDELKKAEGLWPEYPRAVHKMAVKSKTAIPELTLPASQWWDRWRIPRMGMAPLPDPPEHMLREFAAKLLLEDPAAPRLYNPADREELKRRFFDKYPDMLERLRQQDRIKWEKKEWEKKGKMK
jgi:uncharacterized protein YqeY